MGYRFNTPPGWPAVPDGFVPPPGWQPDPSWPPAPEGWQYWVEDPSVPDLPQPGQAGQMPPVGQMPSAGQMPPAGHYPPSGQYPAPGGPAMGMPPYPTYAPYGPGMRQGGTDGFAIASLVLGILGLFWITVPLSIIFGIIALVRIRGTGRSGKGLAIGGLIASGIWILLLVIGLSLASGFGNRTASYSSGLGPVGRAPAAVAHPFGTART